MPQPSSEYSRQEDAGEAGQVLHGGHVGHEGGQQAVVHERRAARPAAAAHPRAPRRQPAPHAQRDGQDGAQAEY